MTGVQTCALPISRQAVALFKDIHTLTGDGRYVFPSLRSADRPISDNTINAALRRLVFRGDEMVGHGFRSTILRIEPISASAIAATVGSAAEFAMVGSLQLGWDQPRDNLHQASRTD